jgi:hypothetical protein
MSLHACDLFIFLTGTFIPLKSPKANTIARRQIKPVPKPTTQARRPKIVNRDEVSLNTKPGSGLA